MKNKLNIKNLTILLTLYSFIYVYTYYAYFGINIFEYTDLQGVLTLFLGNLIKVLSFFSIILIIIPFVKRRKPAKQNLLDSFTLRATKKILIANLGVIVVAISFCMFGLQTQLTSSSVLLSTITAFMALLVSFVAVDKLKRFWKLKTKENATQIKLYVLFLLGIPIFIIQFTLFEVKYITKNITVSFAYQDKLINTGKSSSFNFIGKVNENIFIYDKINKQTIIFEKNSIKDYRVENVVKPLN